MAPCAPLRVTRQGTAWLHPERPPPSRPRALQHALDRISTRYGARALTTGAVRTLTK